MTITTSVTRIELSEVERGILRGAIKTLEEVNDVINKNNNTDYVINNIDMNLYNSIYEEINRIEVFVMVE